MDIRIKHNIQQEIIVKTIAFMMFNSRQINGNYTWSIIKKELTELLTERGMDGTRQLLNEQRFREYDQKAKWEYEELGLKGDRRREMLKESNKNSNKR